MFLIYSWYRFLISSHLRGRKLAIHSEVSVKPSSKYFQIFISLTAALINKTIKHARFNKNQLCATAIIVCITSLYSPVNAATNDSIFDIGHIYKTSKANQRIVFNMDDDGEKLEAIVLIGSIKSTPIKMSFVFQDDVCISKFNLIGGSGHALPNFKCQSGAKIKTKLMCRNTCYVQARHSQKGSWAFNYRYKVNQELSLAAIMAFSGKKNTIVKSPSSGVVSSTGDGFEEPKTSKLDKAKSTCTELGFTLGTEKHGDCALKLMDN